MFYISGLLRMCRIQDGPGFGVCYGILKGMGALRGVYNPIMPNPPQGSLGFPKAP